MAGSPRQFTARKLLPVLVGITVLASGSLGGWTLWSQLGGAPQVDAKQPIIPVESASTSNLKAPPVAGQTAPAIETPEIKVTEVVEPKEASKKELPQGKKHERQEMLLAVMISQLHQEAYQHFISQPGMGRGRMVPFLSVVQREWKMPEWTSEELAKEPPPHKGTKDLGLIHRLSLQYFGDSNTKTQQERLARNAPILHSTGKEYKKEKNQFWEIKSLDLVGLVMHDTPMVYISNKIPLMMEMKDLPKRPIRELDLFEAEGLQELWNGKDLYIRSKDTTIRVLGPIHAGKACLKCHHDTKEGDMLGAFSYTLREGQYQMDGRGLPTGKLTVTPKK
jgi:hypothetical protein